MKNWFINELSRKPGSKILATFTNGQQVEYTTNILQLLIDDPIVSKIEQNGKTIFER